MWRNFGDGVLAFAFFSLVDLLCILVKEDLCSWLTSYRFKLKIVAMFTRNLEARFKLSSQFGGLCIFDLGHFTVSLFQ